MLRLRKRRVQREGPLRTRTTRRSLGRRGRRWSGGQTAASAPPRKEIYTPIDNQGALETEGIVAERELDAEHDLAKLARKFIRLLAKLKPAIDDEERAAEKYQRACENRASFIARFPHAVEVLVKLRESTWKYIVTIMLGLGASIALDYLAMSYLAPNLGSVAYLPGVVNWLLENLAIIGTICIAGTEALVVKYGGKEAAWGFSRLVHDLTTKVDTDEPAGSGEKGTSQPIVYSDRSRRSHQVACILLILALLGVIVVLVMLRELALTMLSGLSGAGDISGLAASQAQSMPSSGGLTAAAGLFIVSVFPLLAAGWAVYLRESPLASSLADLTADEERKLDDLKRATKARLRIKAALENLLTKMDIVAAERDVDQHLARLAVLNAHEIMAEALPELFGMVSPEPPPLMWKAEDLATPYPRALRRVYTWLGQNVNAPEPEPASKNGKRK